MRAIMPYMPKPRGLVGDWHYFPGNSAGNGPKGPSVWVCRGMVAAVGRIVT
jgi:hypothetical protein